MAVTGVVSSCDTSASSWRRTRSEAASASARADRSSGHGVERAGHRGNLVAAAIGSARGEIAGSELARRRFERTQPPPRRAEDHHRGQHRAHDQHAGGDQREHRREAAEEKAERRLRRDDDDARETTGDHDRRRAREAIAAAASEESGEAATAGAFGAVRGTAEHRSFEAWPVRSRAVGSRAVGSIAAASRWPLGPAKQRGARHAEERIGDRFTAAGDHGVVRQHHEERMGVLRVLIAHVARQVGLRIPLEDARQIERDGHAQTRRRLSRQGSSRLRHDPDEQDRLHDQHRGEEADHAERDAPIQASVPGH